MQEARAAAAALAMSTSTVDESRLRPLTDAVDGSDRRDCGVLSRLSERRQVPRAHRGRELLSHALEELRPVARCPLAEESRRRIPGTVAALEQPAPVRNRLQDHPD